MNNLEIHIFINNYYLIKIVIKYFNKIDLK